MSTYAGSSGDSAIARVSANISSGSRPPAFGHRPESIERPQRLTSTRSDHLSPTPDRRGLSPSPPPTPTRLRERTAVRSRARANCRARASALRGDRDDGVDPWTIVDAFSIRAIDTSLPAISAPVMWGTSGYTPSCRAPACRDGTMKLRMSSSRASMTCARTAPSDSARSRMSARSSP